MLAFDVKAKVLQRRPCTNLASHDRAATRNHKAIFNSHQKGLVQFTLRQGDPILREWRTSKRKKG